MKYNEKKILQEIIEYIESTYSQHYSTDGKGLQAMDIFRNMDTDKDFCQSNAIKYLIRYGKKQGRNEKDLIKAIHYIVLLISSERKDNTDNEQKPYNIRGEIIQDWTTTVGQTYHPNNEEHKRIQEKILSQTPNKGNAIFL
jgi:hypothetical protein